MHQILKSRPLLYSLGSVAVLYLWKKIYGRSKPVVYNKQAVVFITGCDTGLGYTMAIYCKDKLNLNVISTCVSKNSEGARNLERHGITVVELDLANDASIANCFKNTESFVKNNNLQLKIFINNAAIMTFGEFDWKPTDLVMKELNINLIGPMKLTKLFMDLILTHSTRLINICSHCSIETLPGLVPYGMSKSALLAWTNGLRTELNKYKIKVIAVIPGSFYTQTSIMSDPQYYLSMMRQNMANRPQPIQEMYGDYFDTYINYVDSISKYSVSLDKPLCIEDDQIMKNIHGALVDKDPRAFYSCTNEFRYRFYHFFFKFLPISYLKDRLIMHFMQMPQYNTQKVK
ncbi:D-beta-hydroxybutyrate dehydrogenase, mitochondrial [Diaphorina citri]|uniref:D-beta-hydroxybutyrate dehydrogenase, mitochondrial n=1 Tax=Diaphorina citri TaxID=121845 RepID=A0A1S3DVA4_DIACI|nr:D-beta-hydroxybutyrate dehydrogenase, mitochondrial [Diaphorina citri]XP_008487646.1 D-beta-hydroxybutyrate dehydrogenase, mitochondrial [Diaphorina citri]